MLALLQPSTIVSPTRKRLYTTTHTRIVNNAVYVGTIAHHNQVLVAYAITTRRKIRRPRVISSSIRWIKHITVSLYKWHINKSTGHTGDTDEHRLAHRQVWHWAKQVWNTFKYLLMPTSLFPILLIVYTITN